MQITIKGYQGQGAKTLSRVLSRASMLAGLNSNNYHDESKAYVRIGKDLLEKGPVNNPDIILVLDPALFSLKEAKENAIFILNTTEKPKAVTKNKNVHVIDAFEIAFKAIGKPVPNMPIAGAFSKYFPKIQIKHIKQAIEIELIKKQKENCLAAEEGLKLVR